MGCLPLSSGSVSAGERTDMHSNKPFLIVRQGQHMAGEHHYRAKKRLLAFAMGSLHDASETSHVCVRCHV